MRSSRMLGQVLNKLSRARPSALPRLMKMSSMSLPTCTNSLWTTRRWMSSSSASSASPDALPTAARAARYHAHGAVEDMIKMEDLELQPLGPRDMLLEFLAAPLNPADFNMIEGVYDIRPTLPAIGGNEGVARIVAKGDKVSDEFKVGDHVIPAEPGFGTWRTHAVCPFYDVIRVAKDVPVEMAATVAVNPCTAWRMLHDFASLQPGDVVIQNGANSAVGVAVVQIAHHMGLRTINIIRDRPDLAYVKTRLKEMGGDVVVTDLVARSRAMKDVLAEFPAPKLGLNCVGGEVATAVARALDKRAPMVTYGGMSRKPVTVPTGALIFNDIQLRGFWLSRWTAEHSREERQAMLDEVMGLIRTGSLEANIELVPFSKFFEAVARAKEGFRTQKVVLDLRA